MSASIARLRTVSLLSAGALAVHQLRYSLAFGGRADHALASQGHGYLGWLVPVVVGGAVLGFALWLGRIAAGAVAARGSRQRVWAGAAAALISVYVLQESIEGLLAPGHPHGLAGVFGHGGWIALPLAVAIGGLITLAHRIRRAPVMELAREAWAGVVPTVPPILGAVRQSLRPLVALLASNLAARPPPFVAAV